MVRLFVPAGEGQHITVPASPEPLPASTYMYRLPTGIFSAALITTGILSILGKSRPGTFLRCTAMWTPIAGAVAAIPSYAYHKGTTELMKREGIQPKPAKLIERSENVTTDTFALAGAVVALALARRKAAFPGVSGWKRYLGVSMVGSAAGYTSAAYIFLDGPSYERALFQYKMDMQQAALYGRTHRFMEDPALVGRFTSFVMSKFRAVVGDDEEELDLDGDEEAMQTGDEPQYIHCVDVDARSMLGCGYMDAGQSYGESLDSSSVPDLDNYLADLVPLGTIYKREWVYVWDMLLKKEAEYFQMGPEDEAKRDLAAQLRLLNYLAEKLALQFALIEHRCRDAKRIRDVLAKEATPQPGIIDQEYAPHLAASHFRKLWAFCKFLGQLVDLIEENPSLPDPTPTQVPRSPEERESFREDAKAIETLLKEIEARIRDVESRE